MFTTEVMWSIGKDEGTSLEMCLVHMKLIRNITNLNDREIQYFRSRETSDICRVTYDRNCDTLLLI